MGMWPQGEVQPLRVALLEAAESEPQIIRRPPVSFRPDAGELRKAVLQIGEQPPRISLSGPPYSVRIESEPLGVAIRVDQGVHRLHAGAVTSVQIFDRLPGDPRVQLADDLKAERLVGRDGLL